MDTVLAINRQVYDDFSTIGEMLFNGVHECFTLEPRWRPATEAKVFGHTAIPPGRYQVVMTYSPHFGQMMPLLLNVPNFEAVRIHMGNFPKDTEGCTLVGARKSKDSILNSRLESDALNAKITSALSQGKVWADYVDDSDHQPNTILHTAGTESPISDLMQ